MILNWFSYFWDPNSVASNIPKKMSLRKSLMMSSGWWFGTFYIFFHILGMSSSQLTFIFFRGVGQPTTSNISGLTLRIGSLPWEIGWHRMSGNPRCFPLIHPENSIFGIQPYLFCWCLILWLSHIIPYYPILLSTLWSIDHAPCHPLCPRWGGKSFDRTADRAARGATGKLRTARQQTHWWFPVYMEVSEYIGTYMDNYIPFYIILYHFIPFIYEYIPSTIYGYEHMWLGNP
jgi:hypothetical protein